MRDLDPTETELNGQWRVGSTGGHEDAVSGRIEWLIGERLVRLATDTSGWNTLYRDPRDGRLWELSYPESGLHGGGPPTLKVVSPEDARSKYELGTA